MLYDLALVFTLVLFNGLLAMSEMAVVSSRPARLQVLLSQGVRGAAKAQKLAAEPGRFLSTVQVGITLVGVLSGAVSGATLGDRLGQTIAAWGVVAPETAAILGIALAVGGITYLSLIIGELVPKQLALRNPEIFACRVAPLMTLISTLAAPLVWLLERSGKAVLFLLGQSGKSDRKVTEEEVKTIMAEAESAGVIEADERNMISRVMRLGDRSVRSVMTPRHQVDLIDLSWSITEVRDVIARSPHSRFPVHEGDGESFTGIIWTKDLINLVPEDALDLKKLVRPAPLLLESMDTLDAVEILRRSSVHMGLVHDEYGHFVGVVSSADILEAIVGSFATDGAAPEEPFVRRADGSALVAGWMPISELSDALGVSLPTDAGYETAAGLLIYELGRLPKLGEKTEIHGFIFEVLDLDGLRVDKLLVTRAAPVLTSV
jgi:putative hemolysin